MDVEFKFFRVENHSVNYSNITDLQVKRNIWDRICGVGDIVIHTSNDDYGDSETKALILRDVRHVEKIKEEISRKIHL